MADMSGEGGAEGYLYEPVRSDFPNLCLLSEISSDSDHSEPENFAINWREGRSKMATAEWCRCGNCVVQQTDDECYCCKDHELLVHYLNSVNCATDIADLEEYVAHKPSLEMAFVNGMIRRCLKGPVPQQLSNR